MKDSGAHQLDGAQMKYQNAVDYIFWVDIVYYLEETYKKHSAVYQPTLNLE